MKKFSILNSSPEKNKIINSDKLLKRSKLNKKLTFMIDPE